MNFKNSKFYGLQSKQRLKELLYIKRDVYCKSSFINTKINVYLDKNGRIIEAPDDDIKAIQGIISKSLLTIGVPNYVFSAVRGRGYKDIEAIHNEIDNTICLDIKKFYYNISRNKIYNFYINKLKNSKDVANILTNLSTIDLRLKNYCGSNEIYNLVKDRAILSNHLIAGSPISTILSFYANAEMFEQINSFCIENNILFSLYVDDLIFSSYELIKENFIADILAILKKYGYSVSLEKNREFKKGDIKKLFVKSK